MKQVTLILAVAVLVVALTGYSQVSAAKTQPEVSANQTSSQKATVISVKGKVSFRDHAVKDGKWQKLNVDQKLGELCQVRTGMGSKAVLQFNDRGRWTVKAASKFGIREYSKKGKHVKARLGLKYGYINGKVDSSRGTNDYRVKTPVATLAVTGTSGNIGYTSDQGMGIKGTTGTWKIGTPKGNQNIKPGQQSNNKRSLPSQVNSQKFAVAVGDPLGQTGKEKKNLGDNSGGRGLLILNNNTGGLLPPPKLPISPRRVPIPPPNPNSDTYNRE